MSRREAFWDFDETGNVESRAGMAWHARAREMPVVVCGEPGERTRENGRGLDRRRHNERTVLYSIMGRI
jgi:hypothetical protein